MKQQPSNSPRIETIKSARCESPQLQLHAVGILDNRYHKTTNNRNHPFLGTKKAKCNRDLSIINDQKSINFRERLQSN